MTGADFGGVDIDLLADYIGGALTGTPEESVVAERIADDPDWQAAYASLGEGMSFVTAELGRLEPETMPADLVARLDTLFEGPAAPHLSLVHGDGPPPVRKTRPAPRRGPRWVTPVAVAAGLIAFVGFGLDYLSGIHRNSASTDSSSAGSAVSAPDAAGQGEVPKFATSGSAPTLSSGIDYTHATLGIAPVQPLAGPSASPGTPGRKTTPEMAGGVESALRRLTAPAALADCLAAIEKANGNGALSAESVDYALFNGSPAVIVRFTAGNGHWAWASGPDCGTPAGGAATLDQVPVG